MANEQNPTNMIEERRVALYYKLCETLGNNKGVYYQPPESLKLQTPCITYELENIYVDNADNLVYTRHIKFRICVIDADPASVIADKVSTLNASVRFIRHFNSNGLSHYIYTITY